MLGVTLIFATDLHHVALMAIRDSYMIFSPKDRKAWIKRLDALTGAKVFEAVK